MEYVNILSKEVQTLNPKQAREVLRYLGYLKSLPDMDDDQSKGEDVDRTKAILDGFRKLRELKAFSHIDDPVAWQREIRKDRPLPGR